MLVSAVAIQTIIFDLETPLGDSRKEDKLE